MKDFITTPQKKIVSKFSTILDEKFWGKADYFTDTINDFPVICKNYIDNNIFNNPVKSHPYFLI